MNSRLAALSALLLSLWSAAPAWGTTSVQSSTLSVEGTSFVLHAGDGREVRSQDMVGATLFLAVEGGNPAVAVRIAAVSRDPQDPEILRHEFEIESAPGQWKRLCRPNADGETWGFPLALPEGHPGRVGPITMACIFAGLAKCVRFGYAPWRHAANGESLLPYHAACAYMLKADYAGDDTPHTRNGTRVDLWDRLGINADDGAPKPGFLFEAGWGPNGAVCVARTRWQDLITLDALRAQYPGRFDEPCDLVEAPARGALLFNRTQQERPPG